MLWQLFLIVCLVWALIVRWQNREKRKLSKQLKNDMSALPFFGTSHHFLGNDEDRMDTIKRVGYEAIKHGGLTHLWLGHRFFCVSVDAEASEYVSKTCLEKDDVLKFIRTLIGNGSIFAPVSIWRRRRKVLAPTFGLRNLNQFVTIFSEQSNVMVNQLKGMAGKGTFSIWDYVTSYTMDSVCQTTLGVNLSVQNQPNHPFLKSFEKYVELTAARILQPWLHSDFIYKFTPYFKLTMQAANYMNKFVSKIIVGKRDAVKEKTQENTVDCNDNSVMKTPKTFLELLIESSGGDNGYTELELREETLVMVSAGTDTSAVGASFVAVMMSKHLDIQEKLYQELYEVFGDSNRTVSPEDLPRLKYLDAVIKETLRLYPPVPITARVTDKEIVLPSGVKLAAGIGFILHIWGIHRNPKYWGADAEEYRPERFFDSPPTHPAAYMPFSCGPRNCLGYQYAMMSMKTVLANLLRQYRILPAEYIRVQGDKQLKVKYDIMMKHVDNYQLQLELRN